MAAHLGVIEAPLESLRRNLETQITLESSPIVKESHLVFMKAHPGVLETIL
jgi:hypothetical protein